MYTLCFRVTIVELDTQQFVVCVLFRYLSLSTIQNLLLYVNAFMANLCRMQQYTF